MASAVTANVASSIHDDEDYHHHQQPLASLSSSLSKRQKNLPASLKISSYLQFQQTKTTPFPVKGSPIRRKPVPSTASITSSAPSSAPSSPPAVYAYDTGASPLRESISLPSLDEVVAAPNLPYHDQSRQTEPVYDGLYIRDLDQYPRGHSAAVTPNPDAVVTAVHSRLPSGSVAASLNNKGGSLLGADHSRTASMAQQPSQSSKPPPIHIDANVRSMSSSSLDSNKQPKTPGNKITSFFGWNNTTSSPPQDAVSSDNSDYGLSHTYSNSLSASPPHTKSIPVPIDINKANNIGKPVPNATPLNSSHLSPGYLAAPIGMEKMNQMEAELREISAELAASIRREMDLEDMVERLQMEVGSTENRRTSDYFSDSGYSSLRYPSSEYGSNAEDFDKMKRKMEQEKASLKVDLSQKWQDEKTKRAKYESHIQILEEQVAQLRRERVESSNMSSKAKELETALDDTRRRLAEERHLKDNFEDLLTAMRVEIEQHRNDNEALQSKLQDAQSNGIDPQKFAIETSRLQQEIQNLKNENATLINARKTQLEMQANAARFNSIAEEGGEPRQVGLTRSNTVARSSQRMSMIGGIGLARSSSVSRGSLSRSNSVSGKDKETKELVTVDKMKDVEMQRDALHRALKSLLDRQSLMTREHEKELKILQTELARAQDASSPRRLGYEKEVGILREEISHLRGRADDCLEQKWQIEKGLGGLKMDLDRAEQETSSLRDLLQEHDIAIPSNLGSPKAALHDVQVTSTSLADAYKQLQSDQKDAASRTPDGSRSLEEEEKLAAQLAASAERSQALATQVRQQLDTNSSLRTRLTEAIRRGDKEQKTSAQRINELQSRLKTLEESLVGAQQQSEDAVNKHEEEIKKIQDSHNAQLRRVRGGARTPTFGPNAPISPLFAARSPRLDVTSSGSGMPLNQALKVEFLENKVKDLEKALDEAGREMQEVVGRMNMAQIEVAELQGDRDEALKQSRKLQQEIQIEREMFQKLLDN